MDNTIHIPRSKLAIRVADAGLQHAIEQAMTDSFRIIECEALDANLATWQSIPDAILIDDSIKPDVVEELLARIHRDKVLAHIAVYVLCTEFDSKIEQRLIEAGAADYLPDNVNIASLRSRLVHGVQLRDKVKHGERMAMVDPLTKLPSLRRFREQLDREWARAVRYKTPIALLTVDLNGLRNVSQTYGDVVANQCLASVARGVEKALCRAADIAARFLGDRIMVILPHTDEEGSRLVAERVWESAKASLGEACEGKVSEPPQLIVISIATEPKRGDLSRAFLQQAIEMLAQEHGRLRLGTLRESA